MNPSLSRFYWLLLPVLFLKASFVIATDGFLYWLFNPESLQTPELFQPVNESASYLDVGNSEEHYFWLTSQPGSSSRRFSYIFNGPVILKHPVAGADVQIHDLGNGLYQVDIDIAGSATREKRLLVLQGSGQLQSMPGPDYQGADDGTKLLFKGSACDCQSTLKAIGRLEHSVAYQGPETSLTSLEQEQKNWLVNPTPEATLVAMFRRRGRAPDLDSGQNDDAEEAEQNTGSEQEVSLDPPEEVVIHTVSPRDSDHHSPPLPVVPYIAGNRAVQQVRPGQAEGRQRLEILQSILVLDTNFGQISVIAFNIHFSQEGGGIFGLQVLAPEGTPQEVVRLLQDQFVETVTSQAVRRRGSCRPEEPPPWRSEYDPDDDRSGHGAPVPVRRRSICDCCTIL